MFESFRKPKKSDVEVDTEYISAHEELKGSVEDLNRARAERARAVDDAEQAVARAKGSLEQSLKELEDLNP